MLPTVARIFVSSTWLDLQPERQAIEDAINRMSAGKFIGMEYFGSRPETTEGASLDEVDRADIYVGIIGGRYGSGITEKEYRRARERALPCFIYFKDDRVVTTEGRDNEAEKAQRLDAFKRELSENHIIATPFTTPAELAICLRDDLYRWFDQQRAAELSRDAAGDIVTTRDDHRFARLQVGAAEGVLICDGLAAKPRPRPTPVRPSVRPFRGLLDRAAESEAALRTLPELAPVEFYGQAGIGKTALLRHLAYNAPEGHFPDGVVYRDQVGRQPATDLLQFLFDSFYESERGYKPREAELLNLLRDKRALVLLDDVELPRAEIERSLNAAPECAFLLSSEERHIFGEGRALLVEGLPGPEAAQLLERELGRLLTPGEQVAAQTICALLEGHPLHIAQAAAAAQDRDLPLGELAEKMQEARAKGQNPADLLNWRLVGAGSDEEKRAMAAMAALEGAPARAETLSAISGISDLKATLERFTERKLVETRADGYRLVGPLQAILQKDWDLTEWRNRALAHLTAWAEAQRRDHRRIEESSAALLAVFNWAMRNGRWDEAKRLGKSLDGMLILSGRWEAWGQVLQQTGQAAAALGDEETAAWVLHQQGSRALCLGDDEAARRWLTEALERRAAMGDHAAASATRHNLDWLFPPAPFTPPNPSASSESAAVPRRAQPGSIPGWLKFLGAALLAGLGGWFFWPEAKPKFTPERLSFPNQPLNQPSARQTVTLTNPGAQELAIDEMRIDGAAASDFTIVSDDCRGRRLARGEKCSVSLVFTPRDAGGREARLKLIGLPADLPELRLSGAATFTSTPTPIVAPSPAVSPAGVNSPTPPPAPRLEISRGEMPFGPRQAQTSSVQSLTLTNRGAAELTISELMINGAQRGDFSLDGCAQRTLKPDGSCAINITFTPGAEGERSAYLIINSNDANSPLSVPLTGRGLAPPPASPDIQPSPLNFGRVEVGNNAVQAITITGVGDTPLRISNVSLQGAPVFNITADGCGNKTLAPRRRACSVSVSFAPRAVGSHRAMLLIETDAAGSPHRVEISGQANAPVRRPKLTISPASHDFGSVTAGDKSKASVFSLRNDGGGALQIGEITLAGADPDDFKLSRDCANSAIQPGQECRLKVSFTPQSRAGRANQDRDCSASLVVRHNGDGGQSEAPLSGNAKRNRPKARFDLTPNYWDFGRWQVGASSQVQGFRLTNQGEEPFSGGRVRIDENILDSLLGQLVGKGATNQGSYNFRIEDNRCNVTLNPGAYCEIVVRFTPRSAGKLRGTLQVSVGDRLATASLSGEGVGEQAPSRRGWCCVNGRIEDLDPRECRLREGRSFPDEVSARRNCYVIR